MTIERSATVIIVISEHLFCFKTNFEQIYIFCVKKKLLGDIPGKETIQSESFQQFLKTRVMVMYHMKRQLNFGAIKYF